MTGRQHCVCTRTTVQIPASMEFGCRAGGRPDTGAAALLAAGGGLLTLPPAQLGPRRWYASGSPASVPVGLSCRTASPVGSISKARFHARSVTNLQGRGGRASSSRLGACTAARRQVAARHSRPTSLAVYLARLGFARPAGRASVASLPPLSPGSRVARGVAADAGGLGEEAGDAGSGGAHPLCDPLTLQVSYLPIHNMWMWHGRKRHQLTDGGSSAFNIAGAPDAAPRSPMLAPACTSAEGTCAQDPAVCPPALFGCWQILHTAGRRQCRPAPVRWASAVGPLRSARGQAGIGYQSTWDCER